MDVRISAAFSCKEDSGSEGRAAAKRAGEMGFAELDMVGFWMAGFGVLLKCQIVARYNSNIVHRPDLRWS